MEINVTTGCAAPKTDSDRPEIIRRKEVVGFYRVGQYDEPMLTLLIVTERPEAETGPFRIIFADVPAEGRVLESTTYRTLEDAKEGAQALCKNKYHGMVASGHGIGKIDWRDTRPEA